MNEIRTNQPQKGLLGAFDGAETISAHQKDMAKFRKRLDGLFQEDLSLDAANSRLLKGVHRLMEVVDEDGVEELAVLCDAVKTYFKGIGSRRALWKEIVEIKRIWDSKAGVDSMLKVEESAATEVAKARAKEESGLEPRVDPDRDSILKKHGGVFGRIG